MENIDRLLAVVIKDIEAVGIKPGNNISPVVVINSRAKKRFGCCKFDRNSGRFVIELSSQMVEAQEKFIKTIIAHEVLHTCNGCQNHGACWKSYANMLNEKYGYKISTTNRPEDFELESSLQPKEPKYILQCEKCGSKIMRTRMARSVKNPAMFRCGKCGGKIKRIK